MAETFVTPLYIDISYVHIHLHAIEAISVMQHMFLSPVFLHCALRRSSYDIPFLQYRTLVGDMGFSENVHTFELYSETHFSVMHHKIRKTSWLTHTLLA
jgi:hypothetical protein